MKRIPAVGPTNARIAVVGEAPGESEEKLGKPFVGRAGQILDKVLLAAGLSRHDLYITNVSKYRPPSNNFSRLPELGVTIDICLAELGSELATLKPNVIIPLGNIALKAITGEEGIKKWRGSLLESSLIPGTKVIPSIHPSHIARGAIDLMPFLLFDMKKAKEQSYYKDFRDQLQRKFILHPDYFTVMTELKRLLAEAKYISLDIEAIRDSDVITEIGLGDSPLRAITIPMYKNAPVWAVNEEMNIWRLVRAILTAPHIPKIMQNVTYEMTQLYQWVGEIRPLFSDTMIGHHLCYCELPKDLDTLASIYTHEPHYKSYSHRADYNAKDVTVTQEVAEAEEKELEQYGLVDFMHGYQMPLQALLWRASTIGVKVDRKVQRDYAETVEKEVGPIQQVLEDLIGHPINVRSPQQVANLLYNEMKLPAQREKGKLTTNAKALKRLRAKHPCSQLDLIEEIRERRTALSTYLNPKRIDPDDRVRTAWIVTGTKTGRLSSKKNIRGTGCNLQNPPKRIRDMFIADEGCSFVVGDLSQVEARFVAYLSEDPNYMALFEAGGDIHKTFASWIWKKDVKAVSSDERKKAKAAAHGTPYGMEPFGLATLYNLSQSEATWLQGVYWNMFPNVKSVFQEGIQQQLLSNRTLVSPFGRRRTFFGFLNKDTYKEAYAQIPQGLAADIIMRAAVRIDFQLPEGADILIQVHDELVIQCRDEDIDEVAALFLKEVAKPVMIKGREVSIPLDVVIGKDWKNTTEWKGESK